MGRRRIVAGNWKMNKTPTEAVALVEELKPLVKNDDVDVVFSLGKDDDPIIFPIDQIDLQPGENALQPFPAQISLGIHIGMHFPDCRPRPFDERQNDIGFAGNKNNDIGFILA